jgi:hypothetical protein
VVNDGVLEGHGVRVCFQAPTKTRSFLWRLLLHECVEIKFSASEEQGAIGLKTLRRHQLLERGQRPRLLR